ncbi:hypothetical protein F8S13_09985 [Chloroflexia bacterium SDU3-3]|nr:hypothetical protein F8S13_09985 [Chloroflexia bacterium SDU3-3]
MALLVTLGALALIIGFGISGFMRDLQRGILVLTGVLFGAALVSFWSAPLAADLSQRLGNPDIALLQRFASTVVFIATTAVVGFGSGLLFPPSAVSSTLFRTTGALLGVFSGCLAAGFLIIYACYENPGFLAQVQASAVGQFLYERVSTLLAGGAAAMAIVVAVVGGNHLLARRAAASAASGAKPTGGAAQKAVLDKINERLGS